MTVAIHPFRFFSMALCTAALLACGGREGSVDADVDSTAPVAETSQPCAATDLCLETRSIRPNTSPLSGLLVVVWGQVSDDGPDPAPKVTYSAPFSGNEARITIPLAAIGAPDEPNRFCKRACTDEASCPCTGKERPGVAYVVVVADANGNGAADLDYELSAEPVIGAANVVLVQSDDEIETMPPEFGSLFPDGVRAGIHPYAVDTTSTSKTQLRPAPGRSFVLSVCDTQLAADCSPDFPDLLGDQRALGTRRDAYRSTMICVPIGPVGDDCTEFLPEFRRAPVGTSLAFGEWKRPALPFREVPWIDLSQSSSPAPSSFSPVVRPSAFS